MQPPTRFADHNRKKSRSRRLGGPGFGLRTARTRHLPSNAQASGSPASATHRCDELQSSRTSPAVRTGPAWAASLLLGTATGMLITAAVISFSDQFAVRSTGAVIGVSLLALAMGVRIPQRFALWVCAIAWRRIIARRGSLDLSRVMFRGVSTDRPLYWIILAVIAMGAGMASAALPLTARFSSVGYRFMAERFLWSGATLTLLQAMTIFVTLLAPLLLLGLAFSCVHHLSCPHGRWETRATSFLLMGTGVGALLANQLALLGARVEMILAATALPAFLTALLAAGSRSAHAKPTTGEPDDDLFPIPSWEDRWPVLLRLSIVTVAGAGASAITFWSRSGWVSTGAVPELIAVALCAMGIGVLAGCRPKRAGSRSIGGFGISCALAGAVIAVSLVLPALQPVRGDWVVFLSGSCVAAAIGHAVAHGRQTLLNRVGSRSIEGASMLARSLVCSAVTVWLAVPVVETLLGIGAARILLALSLLALGGILIIHEPGYSPRTRRLRLLAVFGPLASMIAFSLWVPHWWMVP